MNNIINNHTFIICAYKENPYLEACVRSVVNQTIKSKILISTSTPNDYIKGIARKYNLEIRVNKGKGDQADNFNFAYSCCNTRFVTICHQDDYYSELYLEFINHVLKNVEKPIIAFTDYAEVHNGNIEENNNVLKVKRILLCPLKNRLFQKSKFIRRRMLGLGNPVCCPSITYNKDIIKRLDFNSVYKGTLDYEMLERISNLKGSFVYCNKSLVYHRIWDETDTMASIDNGCRSIEERKILERLWPRWIAGVIAKYYRNAQKYYK